MQRAEQIRGVFEMLRTITIGSCVSIQGTFERQLDGGNIIVRVGQNLFAGRPIEKAAN
jgi:hypothetical protein